MPGLTDWARVPGRSEPRRDRESGSADTAFVRRYGTSNVASGLSGRESPIGPSRGESARTRSAAKYGGCRGTFEVDAIGGGIGRRDPQNAPVKADLRQNARYGGVELVRILLIDPALVEAVDHGPGFRREFGRGVDELGAWEVGEGVDRSPADRFLRTVGPRSAAAREQGGEERKMSGKKKHKPVYKVVVSNVHTRHQPIIGRTFVFARGFFAIRPITPRLRTTGVSPRRPVRGGAVTRFDRRGSKKEVRIYGREFPPNRASHSRVVTGAANG